MWDTKGESKGESKGEPKEPHHIRLLGYQLFVGTCEISDTRLVSNEIFCFLMWKVHLTIPRFHHKRYQLSVWDYETLDWTGLDVCILMWSIHFKVPRLLQRY